MKKCLFLITALFLQTFQPHTPIHAMEGTASCYDQPEQERNQRLTSAFQQIFKKVEIEIDKGFVKFKGTKEAVQKAIRKLGDYSKLRKKIVPISSNINTQAYAKPQFDNWDDCLKCLGINSAQLMNFEVKAENDQENCLKIPYLEMFSRQLADMYLNQIRMLSPYFQWLSKNNKDLITYTPEYMFINYGLLTDHFCSETEQETEEEGDIVTTTLSLDGMLKKIITAAGSEISLTPSSTPGQFHVRTVALGSKLVKERPTPIIEIAIDRSGSMGGDPIQKINETIPKILEQLKSMLQGTDLLQVNIYAFNDNIEHIQSYGLKTDFCIPKWKKIDAKGGTDLTHIGNLLKVKEGENKVVIAFTDGDHASTTSSLENSYIFLRQLRESGYFAQPFLCRVGGGAGSDNYFDKISNIFEGSYSQQDTVQGFCKKVSQAIPSLLVSKEPIVLTIQGEKVVVWQENAQSDIHTTTQTVGHKDAIMHRGITHVVNTSTRSTTLKGQQEVQETKTQESEQARLQAQIAELQAKLKALETGGSTHKPLTL